MNTFAIIPMKSLRNAKTRLAGALSTDERAELASEMLLHVVQTLATSGSIDRIAVISQEPTEVHLPSTVTVLPQSRPGLNNLLEEGREWAISQGAEALLVIFADLPLLAPGDISLMVELGEQPDTVVLAPDRHSAGTNALLSHPPALAHFAFGPSSLDAHIDLARASGAAIRLFNAHGLALDIDTLDDLGYLEAHRLATAMEYAFS